MQAQLELAKKAAVAAGLDIMKIYETDDFDVDFKRDDSPLTKADKKGHDTIVSFLEESELPILSEEGRSIEYSERSQWKRFWMIDPLDGTKEFIKRNGEFTVNIALIENGIPILGVVYVPVLKKLYYGLKGQGAWLDFEENTTALKSKKSSVKLEDVKKEEKLTIVASRSHLSPETEEFIKELVNPSTISMGSSLKFLVLAEGKADIYPRFAPTMEWDTAAAHGVLLGLNFEVRRYPELSPLEYNKENLLNPWFICY